MSISIEEIARRVKHSSLLGTSLGAMDAESENLYFHYKSLPFWAIWHFWKTVFMYCNENLPFKVYVFRLI